MKNPVIGDQFLVEDAEARHHHEAGLSAALGRQPDFSGALGHFKEAQFILEAAEPTIDSGVQLARVWRDMGFTIARKALDLGASSMLEASRAALQKSAGITEVAAGQSDSSLSYDPAHDEPGGASRKQLRREVFAEHGATLGLMGRVVTIEEVMLGMDTRGDDEDAVRARREDQAFYGAAHDFLRIGSNGYYLVSNAMAGARQEILNGQRKQALAWLSRAGQGLAWTAVHDERNMKQAFETAAGRFPHLRTYDVAWASVLVKP